LEHELDQELGRLAARRGVSKAQLLREGARQVLRKGAMLQEDPILAVIGLGQGEPAAVSEKHDQYLAERRLTRSRP
ncbi:MAG: hypothetical protein AB1603_05045, partial [Chloroflexota bacterium]